NGARADARARAVTDRGQPGYAREGGPAPGESGLQPALRLVRNWRERRVRQAQVAEQRLVPCAPPLVVEAGGRGHPGTRTRLAEEAEVKVLAQRQPSHGARVRGGVRLAQIAQLRRK